MFFAPRPPIFLATFFFVCSAETTTPESTHVSSYTIGGATVDAPNKVAPGESFDVTVTVQNTGDTGWGTTATYFDYVGDKDAGGVDLMLVAETAAGATGTFTGTMTAPTDAGDIELVWQPIVEGHELGTPVTLEIAVSGGGGDDGGTDDTGVKKDDTGTKTDDTGTKTDDTAKGGDSGP